MTGLALSTRMKEYYENIYRTFFPRRTNVIIRVDGKGFSKYTRGLEVPYDLGFMEDMDNTAKFLCENIQGTICAYVQSDEISVMLADYQSLVASAWFGNNIQKIVSVSASFTTSEFNRLRLLRVGPEMKWANFDSRAFVIPEKEEVVNYFLFRQNDATRNSIQSTGRAHFSHKETHRVTTKQMVQKLLEEKDVDWNNMPDGWKRGRFVKKNQDGMWEVEAPPIFSQDRNYILDILNKIGVEDD